MSIKTRLYFFKVCRSNLYGLLFVVIVFLFVCLFNIMWMARFPLKEKKEKENKAYKDVSYIPCACKEVLTSGASLTWPRLKEVPTLKLGVRGTLPMYSRKQGCGVD